MKLTFYCVRHGQTLFNVAGRMQGECDSPLTRQGIQEAQDTASALRKINFARCYSSYSERALDTAEILCKPHSGLKPIPMKELKEIDYGDLDGNKPIYFTDEICKALEEDDADYYHGETMDHVKERMEKAFSRMIDEGENGENILVVSHGSYMIHMMQTMLGLDLDIYEKKCHELNRMYMPNAGICIFSYDDGIWTMVEEPMTGDEYRLKYDSKEVTFYYVRHGETRFNKEQRVQGRCDSPLTELGRQQAKETGIKLKDVPFQKVYCSYAERARDTASIILEGRDIPIVWEKRIREMFFGDYEGCNEQELPTDFLQRIMQVRFGDVGGESSEEIKDRISSFIRDAYDEAQDGDQILLVAHGSLYFVLLYVLFSLDSEKMMREDHENHVNSIPNGGICIFTIKDGQAELVKKMSE